MRLFGYLRTFRNWTIYYSRRAGRRHRDRVDPARAERLELLHRNGLRIGVRAGTSDLNVARAIFVDRTYLPRGMEIPEDGVVLDVGANIGCFTLQAARLARRGRVFAWEPEPGNFEMLRDNLARNGFAHARAFPEAVSDVEGESALHLSDATGNTTTHSLYGAGDRTVSVRSTTLAKVMEEQRIDRVDYLKLDCEGAEPRILGGTPDDCLRRVRRLAVEVNRPDEMAAPLERLRGLGFRELPASTASMRYLVREA
jgi:FkbM family methyltransferase